MASDPVKGIYLATPAYGGKVDLVTANCLDQITTVFNKVGLLYQWQRMDMCDIVHARNCMLTTWYDEFPNCDHMLMVDNDMQFEPIMVTQMLGLSKPLCGAVYRKREPQEQGEDIWSKVIGEPLAGDAVHPIERGCQQWKYVGGGVLMIKREVVTKMIKQFPELVDYKDPGHFKRARVTRMLRFFDKMDDPIGRPLSEDYSFCERWLQCGGEVWAAVDFLVGHIGSYTYQLHAARDLDLRHEAVAGHEQNPEEFRWLCDQIKGARAVLEIGSRGGASLEGFAEVCAPGAKLRSIDISRIPALEATVGRLHERGFDVAVLTADSKSQRAIDWAAEQGPYDFVFIDGDHDGDSPQLDWDNYAKLGSLVAMHDIAHPTHTVGKFWRQLKKDHNTTEYVHTDEYMGIGLVIRDKWPASDAEAA